MLTETLFLCEPCTINSLKASYVTNLDSIIAAQPLHYLTDDTINEANELQWGLFIKLAMASDWTDGSQVLSFTKDDWEALDTIQLKANYAALIGTQGRNNADCFEGDDDGPRRTTPMCFDKNNKINNQVVLTTATADNDNNNKKEDSSNNSQLNDCDSYTDGKVQHRLRQRLR